MASKALQMNPFIKMKLKMKSHFLERQILFNFVFICFGFSTFFICDIDRWIIFANLSQC